MCNFRHHFKEYIWPGLGLFGESYLLFSIGTIRPIWDILYPQCFNGVICPNGLLKSLTYSVVSGIICGMVVIGSISGSIGRRGGSITTATLMAIGSLGMTFGAFAFQNSPEAMLKNLVLFLFIFGLGVGGEYPLSASSASERAMSEMKKRIQQDREINDCNDEGTDNIGILVTDFDRDRFDPLKEGRGKRVILVFSMQGMGIFINTLTMTLLLFVTGQWGNDNKGDNGVDDGIDYYQDVVGNYSRHMLLLIWQIIYVIGSIALTYVWISRLLNLEESTVWKDDQTKRQIMKERDEDEYRPPLDEHTFIEYDDESEMKPMGSFFEFSETQLLFEHYGHRLFGTSFTWLLWDVAFYGNKLFQSSFLYALTGEDATLLEISLVALLNAFVALLGYYAAAFLVDRPSIGRLKLQQCGFLITGTLFCLCGFLRDSLSTSWLVTMYFGSSFFGQCGPNTCTFLVPAEIFPTEMRTFCHGISAASGKVGALIAAIIFNYLTENQMFLISGYCSFLALFITFLTIPESSTLDLYELDKKWRSILRGKDYYGPASDLRHLSVWERWGLNKT